MQKKLYLIFVILFLFNLTVQNLEAQNKKVFTIGIVHDGLIKNSEKFMMNLNNELTTLLGTKYDIQIPQENILNANWSVNNAAKHYDQFTKDNQIDVILGFGVLSSSVIARNKTFPKPIILTGIINPKTFNLAPRTQATSGVNNLTYILFNQSVERDVDRFYQIYPYENIGIVFFDELLQLHPLNSDDFENIMTKNSTTFTPISIKQGIDDVLNNLENIDALYLGHLGKFEDNEKVHLIDELTTRGIPTFGFSVKDAKQGAFAAMTPQENMPKIFRRIALDIEAILAKENASDLPVHISFEEKLTLNMKTARKLKISPNFSILSQAVLLNEFDDENVRSIGLNDVIQEAIQASVDLKIQELTVQSDEKEVSLAKSKYFPTLKLGADGFQIDEKRANKSFSTQAERTFSGSASMQQIIFSEQALANISIKKHLLHASEKSRDQVQLDIMLEAGEAYFNILAAKAYVDLRKENHNRIKKNLEIAKQRELVGYSSRSDIYRWESQLSSETTNLIEARNIVRLAKIQLNKILNKPLNEKFTVKDILAEGNMFMEFTNFKKHVRNPHSMEMLTRFFVAEAKQNSNEIQQINASIAALERSLKSNKRQRFLPNIALGAETDYVFSRDGAGSNKTPIMGMSIEPDDSQWAVGINASLPLFKGGEIKHKSEQIQIEIMKLENQKHNLVQNIEMNVQAKVMDLAASVANLDLSKQSAEYAGKSYEMVLDAYTKGAVAIVELTDAQTNMLNAEINSVNSVYEFNRNLMKIQRAICDFVLLKPSSEVVEFSIRFEDYLKENK